MNSSTRCEAVIREPSGPHVRFRPKTDVHPKTAKRKARGGGETVVASRLLTS
jgi:hypothetical protein